MGGMAPRDLPGCGVTPRLWELTPRVVDISGSGPDHFADVGNMVFNRIFSAFSAIS